MGRPAAAHRAGAAGRDVPALRQFGGVGKPGEGLAIDYQVIVEIRAFEVRVDGGEQADVELFVRMLNDRNGVVRASRTFTASAPVAGAGNNAYVGALDAPSAQAAVEIVALDGFPDLIVTTRSGSARHSGRRAAGQFN